MKSLPAVMCLWCFFAGCLLVLTAGPPAAAQDQAPPAAAEQPAVDRGKAPQSEPAQPPAEVAPAEVPAAKAPAEKVPEAKTPVARYLTILNPVNDLTLSRVRNALVNLQQQAEQDGREVLLILELEPGTSSYGHVRELCRELTASSYQRVRTVAWIPQPEKNRRMDGYIAMAALACREIVAHPEVEFGDLGAGRPLDEEERLAVINMVEKQYNARVNGALASGMVNPATAVLRITLESPRGASSTTETRIVTQEELRRLQDSKVAITAVDTIKEQGDVFRLAAARARKFEVLVTHTIDDRTQLADLYAFDRQYLREDLSDGKAPSVRLIRLEGVVDPFLHEFARREINRAVANGTDLIILEIESPGGYLQESLSLANLLADINSKKHRTIAWIPDHALSGAAIIALGCDEIIMAPDARIGDAGPIELREGREFHHAPEKILSDLRVSLKELAERKNRPGALAEAMADKDLAVYQAVHRESGRKTYLTETEIKDSAGEWIQGPMVPESRSGNLLTVNGRRAHELLLAEQPAEDFDAVKARLGIPAAQKVPAAVQSWVDTTVAILKSRPATFLLFLVGLICIYLEAHTMTGIFGIGSALCFILYFWSHYLDGTASGLEILLFVFGLVLLAIEIFLIPGFGVFGITGGLAVIASLVMASHTFVLPSTRQELDDLSWTLGSMSGSFVTMLVAAMALSRVLPAMPGFRRMILAPPGSGQDGPRLKPGATSQTSAISLDPELVHQQGVAVSTLRPAGKAQIGDRLLDVVSDSGFLDPGTPVVVTAVTGNRISVRAIRRES